MIHLKRASLPILGSLFFICAVMPSYADTQTTIETTTIRATPSTITIPATGNYVIVDPLTGRIETGFDPATRLWNGRAIPAGYVLVDQLTGKVIATPDTSGNLIDITTAPATQPLIVAIDNARGDLDRRINESLVTGKLTAREAASIRSELDRVAAQELAAKQSGRVITYSEAFPLVYRLNTLQTNFQPLTAVVTMPGSRFVTNNGQVVFVDELTYRRLAMEKLLDDQYAAGHLSSNQVARLKSRLSDIASLEQRYRKHGEISRSHTATLNDKLDRVRSEFDQDISLIRDKRAHIGIRAD
jgi:hypothetical protein